MQHKATFYVRVAKDKMSMGTTLLDIEDPFKALARAREIAAEMVPLLTPTLPHIRKADNIEILLEVSDPQLPLFEGMKQRGWKWYYDPKAPTLTTLNVLSGPPKQEVVS